jgi:hypothetical protein
VPWISVRRPSRISFLSLMIATLIRSASDNGISSYQNARSAPPRPPHFFRSLVENARSIYSRRQPSSQFALWWLVRPEKTDEPTIPPYIFSGAGSHLSRW